MRYEKKRESFFLPSLVSTFNTSHNYMMKSCGLFDTTTVDFAHGCRIKRQLHECKWAGALFHQSPTFIIMHSKWEVENSWIFLNGSLEWDSEYPLECLYKFS